MKLEKAIIRPGTVLQVINDGSIKASSPGLFSFTEDLSKLPPINPWQIGSNSNSFSKPLEGDEVWIINFADNPLQLYWFRKDKAINNELLNSEDENIEVLCSRDMNGEWATIYLSDGSGWIISKGESIIQIKPNGSIQLNTGFEHRVIDINTQGISIGSEGKSAHPAVYGDVLVEILIALIATLKKIQLVSTPNPYTMAIGTILQTSLPTFEEKISNLLSNHVTLD